MTHQSAKHHLPVGDV
uniref:Uncharacterized protein n=1 Tax=Zea mays TaxID=4577 RepID=B4FLH0_MAIZE|nr:unknown [Zea mays]